jgi:hypothetical protein
MADRGVKTIRTSFSDKSLYFIIEAFRPGNTNIPVMPKTFWSPMISN